MTVPLVGILVELILDQPFAAITVGNTKDITAYVDCETVGVKFKRGRPDRLTEADAGDCTFVVSNLDGRFTTTNTAGPYYGTGTSPGLRKNNRIRITVQYSSNGGVSVTNTSVRYIGYVNAWPNKFEGKDAKAEVSCTDVFKICERVGDSRGNYAEEVIKTNPWAYYPLDESAPSKSFGNVNVNSATSNVTAPLVILPMVDKQIPGDDPNATLNHASLDLQYSDTSPDSGGGVKFTPLPGLHSGGMMLQGMIPNPMPTTSWCIDFWMKADTIATNYKDNTQDYSTILNFNDIPRLASQMSICIDARTNIGNIMLAQDDGDSAPGFTSIYTTITGSNAYVLDGRLHMISVEYTVSTHTTVVYVDGVQVKSTTAHTWPVGMQFLTLGGQDDRSIGNTLARRIRTYAGGLSNVAIFDKNQAGYGTPASRYLAGQGWKGEKVETRITRLLGYVGLSSSQYSIGTGTSLVGAQWTRGNSLLQACHDAAQVEDTPLYVDSDGKIHFDGRLSRILPANGGTLTYTTISATEFQDVSFNDDDSFIINTVDIDGTEVGKQTLANLDGGTSIANYGVYRKPLSGIPFYTDTQAFNLARRLLTRYASPAPRINALTLQNAAALGSTSYVAILALEPNNGIRLTSLNTIYPNSNYAANYDTIIEGIEELITINRHEFTFNSTAVPSFDANETDSGDPNVWQLGVTGHNLVGTTTILDY